MKEILVISGPTCSGKNTIVEEFLRGCIGKKFEETISCTTRRKRKNEVHNYHYKFLTKSDFQKKIDNNDFLEWEVVHENIMYGTEISEIRRINKKGRKVILILDVKGALNIKKKKLNLILVFINPGGLEIIGKRLRDRGEHNEKDIAARLRSAEQEIKKAKNFDFVIENNDGEINAAVKELEKIVI